MLFSLSVSGDARLLYVHGDMHATGSSRTLRDGKVSAISARRIYERNKVRPPCPLVQISRNLCSESAFFADYLLRVYRHSFNLCLQMRINHAEGVPSGKDQGGCDECLTQRGFSVLTVRYKNIDRRQGAVSVSCREIFF